MRCGSLNHSYRLVWNEARQAWVAVAEFARALGKSGGTILLSAALLSSPALSAPVGGQISAGSGSITQSGTTTTVTQNSPKLAVNWQGFNVGGNETVNFVQPNASAIALNRVLGPDASQILGKLNANGQVWLINPNGVLFGKTAQINVGGLVASTLDMSDADFFAGKQTFAGSGGTVTNQGNINAGTVALLGEQVKNEGVIVANLGTVALAAVNKVTLDFAGDKLLNVQVDEGALRALAENRNLIQADGGLVVMTAKAKDALLDTAVNNTGVIRARTIENRNGRILLLGDMQSGSVNTGGTLDASAPNGGDGGFIETSAARVKIANSASITTTAPNGKAGNWLIDPYDFTIAATGGDITGAALSTALGTGAVTIQTAAGSASCTGAACGAGNATGNGDIFVDDAVSWGANQLTLSAYRNININANLNGSGTASLALEYGQAAVAAGNSSNYAINNGAKVSLPAGANFSTKLGSDGATTNWTVITGLGVQGDATVAPATMNLQGMNTALAGNYALGADIDASGTSTWNAGTGFTPVGQNASRFTGKFDGLGHTISGLTINLSGGNAIDYGMFGDTNHAVLQNVGLLNVNIQGGSNGSTGALAGAIRGTTAIRNSYVDGGSVSTATQGVGGLVGVTFDTSTISYSYTNVSVSAGLGGGSGQARAGGLVGINNSAISYSYATGSVSAPGGNANAKQIGGLAGLQNNGSISNSYATGLVTGNNTLGGLVGNFIGGSVNSSYWDKTTTGQNSSAGGGTGLTTAEWPTNGPFSASPSGGAWSTVDWSSGNPYPGLKTLPYITIAANASQTYGSAATVGIASILDQTGTDATARVNTAGLTWTVPTTAATPAGTTVSVSGKGATATGYQVLYTGGLTVGAAPIVISIPSLGVGADDKNKTYGSADPELTWHVASGTLAPGDRLSGILVRDPGENVGSYAIRQGSLSAGSNYILSFANGTLTINKANATVTANSGMTTYSGLVQSISGFTATGLVNGETESVLTGVSAGGFGKSAGTYATTASGTDANYNLSFVDGTLTINKANATVTANSGTLPINGFVQSVSGFTATGLVNGDTESTLTGVSAGGSGRRIGTYTTSASGTDANYKLSFVDGTLTIISNIPTVPGIPVEAYTGAVASTIAGSKPNSAAATPDKATLSGLLTVLSCGQNLPQILQDCR